MYQISTDSCQLIHASIFINTIFPIINVYIQDWISKVKNKLFPKSLLTFLIYLRGLKQSHHGSYYVASC